MSTNTVTSPDAQVGAEYEPYRAMSRAAVASLVLAVLSILGLFFSTLLVLPVIGFVLGLTGYRSICRYPLELVGKIPAILGAVFSAVLFVAGASWHYYDYATEVPEGYHSISFANLQPVREHPELPVSPESLQLNGQKIFVKGYVYPGEQKKNIKRFILVPDRGTCCFGGQPKLTDMIEVTLEDPIRIDYGFSKRKLGGVLRVDTALKPVRDLTGVFYQLNADHLK